MKQPIRYFAFGLLTASILLMIIFMFSDYTKSEDLSVDEMIEKIEEEGFRVLTNTEYISYSVYKDEQKKASEEEEKKIAKADKEKDTDKTKKEDKKDPSENKDKEKSDDQKNEDASENEEGVQKEERKTYKYTLVIEPNMLGDQVSKRLEEKKIIDDARKFYDYLEEKGYSRYIQIGEFNLSSDMTYYEIAETIAHKR